MFAALYVIGQLFLNIMLNITAQHFRDAVSDNNMLYQKLIARIEEALADALDATRGGVFPGYVLVKAKPYEGPSLIRRAIEELKESGYVVSHAQSTLRIDTPKPH
jgi:2C-methyl-D-erythritol 2,4-cyclodiphosphate synthase